MCRKFAQMEYNYNSLGMTRLHAMKEMLKCILAVVTETPLDGRPPLHEKERRRDGRHDL
jgi:hypothetical protein